MSLFIYWYPQFLSKMGISYKYFLHRQELSLREWKIQVHWDWQSTERGPAQVHSLIANQIHTFFKVFKRKKKKNRGKPTLLSPVRKHMGSGIVLWQSLKSFPSWPQTQFWSQDCSPTKKQPPCNEKSPPIPSSIPELTLCCQHNSDCNLEVVTRTVH